jgi:hypothetical protein
MRRDGEDFRSRENRLAMLVRLQRVMNFRPASGQLSSGARRGGNLHDFRQVSAGSPLKKAEFRPKLGWQFNCRPNIGFFQRAALAKISSTAAANSRSAHRRRSRRSSCRVRSSSKALRLSFTMRCTSRGATHLCVTGHEFVGFRGEEAFSFLQRF